MKNVNVFGWTKDFYIFTRYRYNNLLITISRTSYLYDSVIKIYFEIILRKKYKKEYADTSDTYKNKNKEKTILWLFRSVFCFHNLI